MSHQATGVHGSEAEFRTSSRPAGTDTLERTELEKALLTGSRALLECATFEEAAKRIFYACSGVIGATAGYVALLSPTGQENDVLFLESGDLPCTVDPQLPMPIRGLRAVAYDEKRVVYDNDFANSTWMQFMPAGHVDLANVMFAPLVLDDKVVGLIGMANKAGDFTDEDAEVAAAFGELAAVALRKARSEELLREHKTRLQLALGAAEAGTWSWNLQEGDVSWDERLEAIFGFDPGAFSGTPEAWQERVHPDDVDAFRAMLRHVAEEGGRLDTEHRVLLPNGTCRFVRMHGGVVSDEAGTPVRMVGMVTDVTDHKLAEQERRKLEAQMQQTQKDESLGVLAGGIAHDFNNLLVGILGNAELARRDLEPNSSARQSIDEIEMAAMRAADLSRQMLAYSGRGKFVVEPLKLSELIQDLDHLIRTAITKKAHLQFELAQDMPAVPGDVGQLRQLVMNLISNASEALADDGGDICIRTGTVECDREYLNRARSAQALPEGLYAFIEVEDTGCGMSSDTLARVFEPFFTTKFVGRGLGLAVVLGIVRGHDGATMIRSAPDEGTTFRVLLPVPDQGRKPCTTAPATDRQTNLILLVDDEETVRNVARRMLERAGYSVLTATNGREAVTVYQDRADDIACVILDLTMPEMDGLETYRALCGIRQDVCAIFSSGFDERELTTRFPGIGQAAFIQKPYRSENLLSKVQEARQTA